MKGCLMLRIIPRAQLITIAEKPTLCWLELLKPPLCFLGYGPQATWVISFSSNFSSEIDSIQGTFWEGKTRSLMIYCCVLCNSGCEETSFHLFLWMCFFSQSCWNTIPITWNLSSQPLYMIIEARTTFGSPLFREIFITACCVIWSTRNGVIFDSGQINLNVCKTQFREVRLQELGLVCTKAKQSR